MDINGWIKIQLIIWHQLLLELDLAATSRASNKPDQFEYSSKFDSIINLLDLVHEPNVPNLN